MRFHVIGFPHVPTQRYYNAEPFVQKVYNFCKMMTARGHTVYHYGVEQSDPVCTEHITVVPRNVWHLCYGQMNWKKDYFKLNRNDSANRIFFERAVQELSKRVQPQDILISFGAYDDRNIANKFPQVIAVESGIGYSATPWARFKVFESYSILNAHFGIDAVKRISDSHESCVIPNYFDPDLIGPLEEPEDYFVLLGRLIPVKGIDLAIKLTADVGRKLILAGVYNLAEQGYKTLPPHVQAIGHVDEAQKDSLLRKAAALLAPTLYHEPFGNVTIEAMLRGTPVITSDRGAFTETVIPGFNGYRCTWYDEFIKAAKDIPNLSRSQIAEHTRKHYLFDAVAPRFEDYFKHITKAAELPFRPNQYIPVGLE